MTERDIETLLNDILYLGAYTKGSKIEEDWDNCGLLCGRGNKDIKKVMIAVDASIDVVNQAIDNKVDMIITHHPLIFSKRKNITDKDVEGDKLIRLIQNDICLYAMHTNFDLTHMTYAALKAIDKQSKIVCQIANGEYLFAPIDKTMTVRRNIYKDFGDDVLSDNEEIALGYGAKFTFKDKKQATLKEIAEIIKNALGLQAVRVYGDINAAPSKCAICPGSGKSFADYVSDEMVYITGDMDHHTCMDIVENGGYVIDAGHVGIEKVFSNYLAEELGKLPDNKSIEIVVAKEENPFVTI